MTEISIDGFDFLIDGVKTYSGRWHEGRRIEGLLMNSRMVQATFDDDEPATRANWAYPDTKRWDPDRNTDEFCAALPLYREKGLLAVTIGLQGGGSIYTRPLYDRYLNSAFEPSGALRPAYMARVARVLAAADAQGMAVIVNYFYWRQERFEDDAAVRRATREATEWLLATGHRNLMVDVRNEMRQGDGLLASRGIHDLVGIVRGTTLNGRRLLVGVSTLPHNLRPDGKWADLVDLFLPHGNDMPPHVLRSQLRDLRDSDLLRARPRPVCCNEDSIDLKSMEAAIDAGCSWGYYDQGFGCGESQGKMDWLKRPRETRYEDLSGFQTVPVNWTINTDHKRAFFDRLEAITKSS